MVSFFSPGPPSPVLETPRLLLRVPVLEDLAAWTTCMADEETARFIGGVRPRAVVWRDLATVAGSWTVMGFGMFSVIEKATDRWIGRLGPWMPEGWPGTEVGYALTRDVWGKGYAIEGVTAAIGWAFDTLGWTEVIHTINPENTASQAVARRVGATNRGKGQLPPPFEWESVEIWGQTREEWEQRPLERRTVAP